ncbi:hypothetical protein KFL_001440190 [Klebsormidium nitens]|uniref:Uncharacterized protein n=1 Tax=Klebsormidium nitens TaxID=105231 RepID=A0A1Y1I2C0_KLENI|nr:hypothetical protein KFL_001440190 [Klebsormidium nitens]|eukprot:GAQ83331.1 hypothetical protein KFL_001440190 [Klebsormidium nitens]
MQLASGVGRRNLNVRIRASSSDSNVEPPAWELKPEVPKEYWFAVTEANKMLLHGPQLETVLRDAVERAERSNLPRNTWLIFEPTFLEEHPGLKGVKKDMKGQVAAIVSTNQDWMIQIVKPMLPGVVIGKFLFPSKYIKDPLASAIKASPNVPSGAGIWH